MDLSQRLAPGDPAPVGAALDTTGGILQFDTVWSDGPVFLTFLRHFG